MSNEINNYKFWLAEASAIIDEMLPYVDDDLAIREAANNFRNLKLVQDAVRSQSKQNEENKKKDDCYKVEFLTGVKELKPLDYTLRKLPSGLWELSCEYSTLTGDYISIMTAIGYSGIRFRIVK